MLKRRTRRLEIRPLKMSDYSAWRLAFSTMLPVRNKFDEVNRPAKDLRVSRFRKVIREQDTLRKKGRAYRFGIFLNTSQDFIGAISISDVCRGDVQEADLGYRILNRYWGKGYGGEAARVAIDIIFKDLKLHRVESAIERDNSRSVALVRSLGMRYEGLSRRRMYLRGRWQDLKIYALTAEEYGLTGSIFRKK